MKLHEAYDDENDLEREVSAIDVSEIEYSDSVRPFPWRDDVSDRGNRYEYDHTRPDSDLVRYLKKSSRYALLSQKEESDLALRVRAGDRRAIATLVLSNLRLVVKFARRYRDRGLDMEDLVQEGKMGLIRAAQLFDPEKGTRFSTYASIWIIQSISRAVDNKARIIRLPVNLHQTIRNLRQIRTAIEVERGSPPTVEELAQLATLSVERVRIALSAADAVASLNQTVGAQSDLELGEQIAGADSSDVEFAVERQLSRQCVRELMTSLDENELKVISLRYGLDDSDGIDFQQIAERTGLSYEKVKKLYAVAIRKMRRKLTSVNQKATKRDDNRRGLYAL